MIKKRKFLFLILLVLIMGGLLLGISIVKAANGSGGTDDSAGARVLNNLVSTQAGADLPAGEIADVVSTVIKGALGLVAIIFFIMIVIAGFRWMTAGGNEQIVSDAKKNISNAVIGLIVILFSYAITYFVFDVLLNKTG